MGSQREQIQTHMGAILTHSHMYLQGPILVHRGTYCPVATNCAPQPVTMMFSHHGSRFTALWDGLSGQLTLLATLHLLWLPHQPHSTTHTKTCPANAAAAAQQVLLAESRRVERSKGVVRSEVGAGRQSICSFRSSLSPFYWERRWRELRRWRAGMWGRNPF